jgi:hypothetical protein
MVPVQQSRADRTCGVLESTCCEYTSLPGVHPGRQGFDGFRYRVNSMQSWTRREVVEAMNQRWPLQGRNKGMGSSQEGGVT